MTRETWGLGPSLADGSVSSVSRVDQNESLFQRVLLCTQGLPFLTIALFDCLTSLLVLTERIK